MNAMRIEAEQTSDLAEMYAWLAHHRGDVVELDNRHNLSLGVPITGARAVIVAAALDNGVGGVLRALSNPVDQGRVRLVFDIRAKGGLEPADVRAMGEEVVQSITDLIAREPRAEKVA